MVVGDGDGAWGKWVMVVKRYKTFNCKIDKPWGCDVQHGDYN